MKKLLNIFCTLWLLLSAVPVFAGEPGGDIKKKKTSTKLILSMPTRVSISTINMETSMSQRGMRIKLRLTSS
ncbi:hypothetical protein [Flavobacterium sp. 3HN19-14]|uniref:hypothetical protein n=1 Tax=Flavobacterium sp. 3HN19-14 TaxID=3448133 RepID=UPI003EE03BC6